MSRHLPKALAILLVFISNILNAQNNPPVAENDSASIFAGEFSPLTFLLNNDSDPDGDSIYVDTIFPASHGWYEVFLSNVVQYHSDSFYYGIEVIDYVVCDNGNPSMCDTAQMVIDINYKMYEVGKFFDANKIKARLNASGNLFWDLNDKASFEVPKGSGLHSLFAGNLWLAGLDDQNDLHCAAEHYGQQGTDWTAGPMMDPIHYTDEDSARNKLWKVDRASIDHHLANWSDESYTMPPDIATWPGNGDASLGQAQFLAPFFDCDLDSIYEPEDGEYPLIKGDQAVYFIFHDDKTPHTQSNGTKLGAEVHAMAYGFNNPADEALHRTMFLEYTVVNRSQEDYHDCYLSIWSDLSLGNAADNYAGCDVARGVYYVYNGDEVDEDGGGALGYQTDPPSLGIRFLAGPFLDPDGLDNEVGIGPNESLNGQGFGDGIADNERWGMSSFVLHGNSTSPPTGIPQTDTAFYNYQRAIWADGTPMCYGGSGYPGPWGCDTAVPAKFMFPGTSDSLGFGTGGVEHLLWNELTASNSPSWRQGLGSTGPFTLAAGQAQVFELAYVWGRSTISANASRELMLIKSDSIQDYYNDTLVQGYYLPACLPGAVAEGPQLNTLSVFPNPVKDQLTLDLPPTLNGLPLTVTMHDLAGRLVQQHKTTGSQKQRIDVADLPAGLYFLRIKSPTGYLGARFVKQ